jgi:hypothetical protein
MPRYIGTLNVTHRDFTSTSEELTPPSPTSPFPNTKLQKQKSSTLPPLSISHTPFRTVTALPEVQIDKNRHVPMSEFKG